MTRPHHCTVHTLLIIYTVLYFPRSLLWSLGCSSEYPLGSCFFLLFLCQLAVENHLLTHCTSWLSVGPSSSTGVPFGGLSLGGHQWAPQSFPIHHFILFFTCFFFSKMVPLSSPKMPEGSSKPSPTLNRSQVSAELRLQETERIVVHL